MPRELQFCTSWRLRPDFLKRKSRVGEAPSQNHEELRRIRAVGGEGRTPHGLRVSVKRGKMGDVSFLLVRGPLSALSSPWSVVPRGP